MFNLSTFGSLTYRLKSVKRFSAVLFTFFRTLRPGRQPKVQRVFIYIRPCRFMQAVLPARHKKNQATLEPNGISANFANLKNCRPNGMPMIVTHQRQPIAANTAASGSPDTISHTMFSSKLPAPPPNSTSFPNGKNESEANLKHCSPTGIPTIVTHHSMPETIQHRPAIQPPNTNHKIFPKHPMAYYITAFSPMQGSLRRQNR